MKPDKNSNVPVRIAIVEDDAGLRGIFAGWLAEAEGMKVVSQFKDAESALKALPGDPPGQPHSHPHRHQPLRHSHAHYPDLHHRHGRDQHTPGNET